MSADGRAPMPETLLLSVVVAVRDSASTLSEVLAAIRSSDLPRDAYELIVVDDASTDGSVAIAARYADTVVKLRGRRSGPAYARNRGAELARGAVLAFVDGDVVVRRDTLPLMLHTLDARQDIDAVSASQLRRTQLRLAVLERASSIRRTAPFCAVRSVRAGMRGRARQSVLLGRNV